MRWHKKEPKVIHAGETRIIKRFLFLPRTIENETRWLETVWIRQVYRPQNSLEWRCIIGPWYDQGWAA